MAHIGLLIQIGVSHNYKTGSFSRFFFDSRLRKTRTLLMSVVMVAVTTMVMVVPLMMVAAMVPAVV